MLQICCRHDITPPRETNQRKSPVQHSNSPPPERLKMVDYSDIYGTGVDASSKHSFSKEPKRARSPYPPSAAVVGSSSVQHDFERHVVWISVYYLGRVFIYIYIGY